MKKKLLIFCIIFAALYYLQFGRKETVICSNIVHTDTEYTRDLQVMVNKLVIVNKKSYAEHLKKKILGNDLNGVIFSGDAKNMNELDVTVYANRISYYLDQKFEFIIKQY